MTILRSGADLITICDLFGIGIPQTPPHSVTGGLLHRMWRVETERGTFAVKVLNSEIMSRPSAKLNYRISEKVAQAAYRNGIRAVTAQTVGDAPWVELDGQYIMVFEWVTGHTLRSEQCTSEHVSKIGKTLLHIHSLDLVIADLEPSVVSVIPDETWRSHIEKARHGIACWGLEYKFLQNDVFNWSRLYEHATESLGQQFVISHRDLDRKNVIWTTENTPYLIDWESAGYVNPTVELIEVALNWSRNHDGTSNKERFQATVEAYIGAGGTLHGKVSDAVYGSLGGMLGWLEYNMHRSLDEDVFSAEDRELGHQEVLHTVHELKRLTESVADYARWVEEVAGA